MNAEAQLFTPEQRRRNLVLGSLLGLLSLVLMVTFMIIFIRNGLPKDPVEWKRLQALKAENQDQPSIPTTAPAAPDGERGPR